MNLVPAWIVQQAVVGSLANAWPPLGSLHGRSACRAVREAKKGHSVQSVVCCGHSPKSQITHLAFQPSGTFLVRSASLPALVLL